MKASYSSSKVVIVDNDENVCSLLKFIFHREGCEVVCINDGKMFLEHIENNPPADIILTEINVPQVGGIEITRHARNNLVWANTPVVILSSISSENKISEAFNNGVNDYITKPFQIGELVARVKARVSDSRRL
jgi:two-component system OmpR family response regulator